MAPRALALVNLIAAVTAQSTCGSDPKLWGTVNPSAYPKSATFLVRIRAFPCPSGYASCGHETSGVIAAFGSDGTIRSAPKDLTAGADGMGSTTFTAYANTDGEEMTFMYATSLCTGCSTIVGPAIQLSHGGSHGLNLYAAQQCTTGCGASSTCGSSGTNMPSPPPSPSTPSTQAPPPPQSTQSSPTAATVLVEPGGAIHVRSGATLIVGEPID